MQFYLILYRNLLNRMSKDFLAMQYSYKKLFTKMCGNFCKFYSALKYQIRIPGFQALRSDPEPLRQPLTPVYKHQHHYRKDRV